MFQWPGSGDYFHMLHHKHFDCNYGAMHVPLDYLFGTYAGSKQEVRPGWREEISRSLHVMCRCHRYGAASPRARRPTTPLCTRPATSRTRWSSEQLHTEISNEHLQYFLICDLLVNLILIV